MATDENVNMVFLQEEKLWKIKRLLDKQTALHFHDFLGLGYRQLGGNIQAKDALEAMTLINGFDAFSRTLLQQMVRIWRARRFSSRFRRKVIRSAVLARTFASDGTKFFEAAVLVSLMGYWGASFSLLRIGIERVLMGIYESMDPRRTKRILRITGPAGIISKLADEEFSKIQTGMEFPAILYKKQAQTLTKLYRAYSGAVHGQALDAKQELDLIRKSTTWGDLGKRLREDQLALRRQLLRHMRTTLDVLALSHFLCLVLVSRGRLLDYLGNHEARQISNTLGDLETTRTSIMNILEAHSARSPMVRDRPAD